MSSEGESGRERVLRLAFTEEHWEELTLALARRARAFSELATKFTVSGDFASAERVTARARLIEQMRDDITRALVDAPHGELTRSTRSDWQTAEG